MDQIESQSMTYSAEVERYFAHPVNAGVLTGDPAEIVAGCAGDRQFGTEVTFYLRIRAQRIAAISFQVFGCPHTVAACCLASERLTGEPIAAIEGFQPTTLMSALGVPTEKTGRLLIIQDALRKCLITWDNRGLT
jgi:NifU-like protein involved in Fe-S cluster formation